MAKASPPDDTRKRAWAAARSAIRAYARNPCATTERGVEVAVEGIRQESALGMRRTAARRPGSDGATRT